FVGPRRSILLPYSTVFHDADDSAARIRFRGSRCEIPARGKSEGSPVHDDRLIGPPHLIIDLPVTSNDPAVKCEFQLFCAASACKPALKTVPEILEMQLDQGPVAAAQRPISQ